MDKNLRNVLRLAGLLREQDDPADQPSPGGAPSGPAAGEGGDDPAAMLDQAIELLNKVKAAMSGGGEAGGAGPGPGPGPSGPGAGGPPPV